jgi:hypothetical protein
MKCPLYKILLILICLVSIETVSYACNINDCNSIDSVGLDSSKHYISNFYENYLSHVDTKEDRTTLYIESEDGSFSDSVSLKIGQTKTFHDFKITLLKIDTLRDISTFVRGDLPPCFSYCYPVGGDNYCGMNEEWNYPLDCKSIYCGDGKCEDFDRRNCHEDCANDFCGDGKCESFEIGKCPSDCNIQVVSAGSFNVGGYITQNVKYSIDNKYSIIYVDSNYKDIGLEPSDLTGTFRLYDGDTLIKEFQLKKIDGVKQSISEIPYAFMYIWNEPKERALVDIFKVLKPQIDMQLNWRDGFFCDNNFITLSKHIYPNSKNSIILVLESMGSSDTIELNQDLSKVNSILEKKDLLHCKGSILQVEKVDVDKEQIILTFLGGNMDLDKCKSDSECNDNDISTKDSCYGNPKKCNNTKITECISDDNYCPPNCKYSKDKDCDQCNKNEDCNDDNACTKDECTGKPKKCTNQRITSGCDVDGNCVPIGTRNGSKFCNVENLLKDQQAKELDCNNNYECQSNICVNNKCIEPSLLKKIVDWFKNLFGRK